MSISLSTRQGRPLTVSFFVNRNLTGAVTIEFSKTRLFVPVSLTKTATPVSGKVEFILTAGEMDSLRDTRFRVKDSGGRVIETGQVDFQVSKPNASAGTVARLYNSVTQTYEDSPIALFIGPVDPETVGIDPVDVDGWLDTSPVESAGSLGTLMHPEYWSSAPHSARGTLATTQDRLMLAPFLVPRTVTVTQFSIDVTVAAAGATLDVAIYASRPNDSAPGSLVHAEMGLSAAAVATSVPSATFSQVLEPGIYWIGAVARGGTPTVRSIATGGTSNVVPQETPGGASIFNALRYNTAGAPLPATIPQIDGNTVQYSSAPPLVWFKVV